MKIIIFIFVFVCFGFSKVYTLKDFNETNETIKDKKYIDDMFKYFDENPDKVKKDHIKLKKVRRFLLKK